MYNLQESQSKPTAEGIMWLANETASSMCHIEKDTQKERHLKIALMNLEKIESHAAEMRRKLEVLNA